MHNPRCTQKNSLMHTKCISINEGNVKKKKKKKEHLINKKFNLNIILLLQKIHIFYYFQKIILNIK